MYSNFDVEHQHMNLIQIKIEFVREKEWYLKKRWLRSGGALSAHLKNPFLICENWQQNNHNITHKILIIMLPDILFNELDGAAFNQACEFCSNFAWKCMEKEIEKSLIIE